MSQKVREPRRSRQHLRKTTTQFVPKTMFVVPVRARRTDLKSAPVCAPSAHTTLLPFAEC